MQEKDVKRSYVNPLEEMTLPSSFTRFACMALDIAIFIVLSIAILVTSTIIVTRSSSSKYQKMNNLQNDHITYSHLANYVEGRGYIKFEEDEYFKKEDNGYLIIEHLSYFYLHYMENYDIDQYQEGSLEPVDTYDVKWFNENVLELDNEDYFVYQKTDGVKDPTLIGTINEIYIVDDIVDGVPVKRVSMTPELAKFVTNKYKIAMDTFFAQKFIKAAGNYMTLVSSLLLFFSTLGSMLIFYILIPIFNPFGRTLGMMFFKLSLVSDDGFLIKKYQLPLRLIPLLAVTAFISFINVLLLQIIVAILLGLISISTMIFTKRKQTLADFISRTITIINDGVVVYKNKEEYERVHQVIEETNNGK